MHCCRSDIRVTSDVYKRQVQVRDFSKVNFKVINDYVKSIREDRLDGYYGGVHPSERKEFSEHIALKKFPDPKTVVISMSQHLGAPADVYKRQAQG